MAAQKSDQPETAGRQEVDGRQARPGDEPWTHDVSTVARQRREQKQEARHERGQNLKAKAYDKVPNKLKNATDLQVRFRTGFVYTAVTVLCVLAGNTPMMLMLMVVAGICAGELFYMLRKDARLPNEVLGIVGAVLYPPSVFFFELAGALCVSILLMLALIVWYVFWHRARISDVSVSFFGATYTGLLLCGLILVRGSLPAPWGRYSGAAHFLERVGERLLCLFGGLAFRPSQDGSTHLA